MQVESSALLRNVAIVGHKDTGKTTLTSAMLYTAGVTGRLDEIEQGNTTTDFDAEEIARSMSIGLAPCWLPWRKHKINIIDCPGSGIFLNESRAGIRAADTTLLNINATAGIEVASEKAWGYAQEYGVPVILNISKMDRENADPAGVLGAIQKHFSRSAIPIQFPIGRENAFKGIVNLVTGKAWSFESNGKCKACDVPKDLADEVEEARALLMETIAENDEELMERYFEAGELSTEEMASGLKTGTGNRSLFPVVFTAGLPGIGTGSLLDAIIDVCPSPEDRASCPSAEGEKIAYDDSVARAIVFKTLNDPFSGKLSLLRVVSGTLRGDSTCHNVNLDQEERLGHLMHVQGKQGESVNKLIAGDIGSVAKLKSTITGHTLTEKGDTREVAWIDIREPAISFAIEPKSRGDEEKIGDACVRLVEEDPTLRAGRDPQTGEFLLSGTGQLHVEIAVAKLKSRSKVEVLLHPPKVPYRETIRRSAEGHGRHKKQSGGRGQFADCTISLEPANGVEEFEFVDKIFGGSIPQSFRPAVQKGIAESASKGFLAGFPVVEFRALLLDGQYHDVDSSEVAFKIAGSLAFKNAMGNAAPTILEPIMEVEISTTEDFMGDIMSDLAQRRGKPQGMETRNNAVQIVKALVPMAEMLNYETALRSMTQGRSNFAMEFSHYEDVPKSIQHKIIQAEESKQEA